MAAIVKFHRPSGETIYVNAEHVVMVMEAPANRATLHLTDGLREVEVDATAEAVAETLTSAASGFVVPTPIRGFEPLAGEAETRST